MMPLNRATGNNNKYSANVRPRPTPVCTFTSPACQRWCAAKGRAEACCDNRRIRDRRSIFISEPLLRPWRLQEEDCVAQAFVGIGGARSYC